MFNLKMVKWLQKLFVRNKINVSANGTSRQVYVVCTCIRECKGLCGMCIKPRFLRLTVASCLLQIFEAAEAKLVADVTGMPLSLDGIVLRLRGLPFSCAGEDVSKFISPVAPVGGDRGVVFVCSKDGKPTGEAFMQVSSEKEAQTCIETKHNGNLGLRYIEVFASSKADLYHAVYSKAFYVAFKGIREYHPPLDISGFSHSPEASYSLRSAPPGVTEHSSSATSRLGHQFSTLAVSTPTYHAGPYRHASPAVPAGRPMVGGRPPLLITQGPGPAPFQYPGQHVFMAPYLIPTPPGWTIVPPRQEFYARNVRGSLQYYGIPGHYQHRGTIQIPRPTATNRHTGTRGQLHTALAVPKMVSASTLGTRSTAAPTYPPKEENVEKGKEEEKEGEGEEGDDDGDRKQQATTALDKTNTSTGGEAGGVCKLQEEAPDESVGSADTFSCKTNSEDDSDKDEEYSC